jgi:hypothetical protein
MKDIKYSVWCGGIEVNDYYLNKQQAFALRDKYIAKGYDDVIIEKQYNNL